MKHLFTTLFFVVTALSVSAQQHWLNQPQPTPSKVGVQCAPEGDNQEDRPAIAQQRGGGTIIFQETFGNGLAGVNGNGAWTAEDNQNGNLWIYVGPNGATYLDGTSTGSVHPGGVYSDPTPLQSATQGDGWFIFDNDFYHDGPIGPNNPAISTEGTLTSPSIDCAGLEYVGVSWDSYFRWCCSGSSAPVTLEVGVMNDGETEWTSFDASDNGTVNDASPNPLSQALDVSCVAAYQDSVMLRFAWRQNESGVLQSHYHWGIDDVTVTALEALTDLRITQIVNGDVFNDFEYRLTPMEQAVASAEGGVLAGVMVQNVGTTTVENIPVSMEILDAEGTSLALVNDTIDVVYAISDAPDCPATQTRDTLYLPTGWEPETTGTYTLRVALGSDSLEATPGDNSLSKEFLYTDDIYGHDDESLIDFQYWGTQEEDSNGEPTGLYDPSGFGNFFHCPNEGSQAYGLAVRFASRCSWNVNDQPDELEFETRIYEVDLNGTVGLDGSAYESAYWLYEDFGSLANGEIYLPFDSPVDLLGEGYFHFAAVINEYSSTGRLAVLGQSASDSDNSTGVYRGGWTQGQTYSPAIRVITSEREALVMMDELLTEQGVVLEQNMPNPANGTTAIRFRLAQHHDVALEVRDIMGRTVAQKDMGTLGAGLHTWELNVGDWASGVYTYTLKADRWSTTKKMSVK